MNDFYEEVFKILSSAVIYVYVQSRLCTVRVIANDGRKFEMTGGGLGSLSSCMDLVIKDLQKEYLKP